MSRRQKNSSIRMIGKLRRTLEPMLPTSLHDSALFVDLGDIYEFCLWYVDNLEKITLKKRPVSATQMSSLLFKIYIQLTEHLPYHQRSLKREVNKVINGLESGPRRPEKTTTKQIARSNTI